MIHAALGSVSPDVALPARDEAIHTSRRAGMPEDGNNGGGLEQILKRVDFFKPVATRRRFMQTLVAGSGVAAAGAIGLGKVVNVLADATTDFAAAAVGA